MLGWVGMNEKLKMKNEKYLTEWGMNEE